MVGRGRTLASRCQTGTDGAEDEATVYGYRMTSLSVVSDSDFAFLRLFRFPDTEKIPEFFFRSSPNLPLKKFPTETDENRTIPKKTKGLPPRR
ncbi:hypothetical protein TNIN_80391 [Trichonephila inaurata madagascariensis]|uniref:Uncharacterized protein n=1 Tax=Trichonephila inaurata madagascariensis TaxID=2747483 RepID=A0A8X6Y1E7_9ARAC|nr:hypothetical protein TNIN_80391 [Trichonephila inaurata madagascariensis]